MEPIEETAERQTREGSRTPTPSVPFLSEGMKGWPDFVAWRLAGGGDPNARCLCELCPLNGKRKVGCDGDPRSKHLAIGESPGKDESEDGIPYGRPYGRPFKGKAGYLFKLEMLVAAELAKAIDEGEHKWPRVADMKVWVANLIQCQPPKNKITTKEGKKAEIACGESLKRLVLMLLTADPNRTVDPMGAYPTSWILGKTPAQKGFKAVPINAYRGYELGPYDLDFYKRMLAPTPLNERIAYLLRGVKPPKSWVGVKREEPGLYRAMTFDPETFEYRETVIRCDTGWKPLVTWIIKALDKASKDAEKEAAIRRTPAEIIEWGKLWRKQKGAATRAAKRLAENPDGESKGDREDEAKRNDTGRTRSKRRDVDPSVEGESKPRKSSRPVRISHGDG